jgi:hypothetical protein
MVKVMHVNVNQAQNTRKQSYWWVHKVRAN